MALADVERMQQEGISNSQWKQVLQWGCFNIFFPVAPCPLCCFLGDWGAAVPSFQAGADPGNACGAREEICVLWLILLLIHNPDTAPVTTKIPAHGNTFPQNQPCLATALKHLLKSGKMEISPWISFTFLLPSGWHFPPSFPFPSPVQKELIYEGDKGEQILEEPLWPQCHVFDKCPMFKKNEVKFWIISEQTAGQ